MAIHRIDTALHPAWWRRARWMPFFWPFCAWRVSEDMPGVTTFREYVGGA